MNVFLITPPLLAPNAPYPATPLLAAALKRRGIAARQSDLSIELLARVFSREGLSRLADGVRRRAGDENSLPPAARRFLRRLPRYLDAVEPAREFLAGRRPAPPSPLPRGPRFRFLAELRRANPAAAESARRDRRLLASLFLDDIADFIRDAADERFGFSRYAERLAVSAPSFDPILQALEGRPSPIDRLLDRLALETCRERPADLVGITVPFPGNLYAALRIARVIRRSAPRTRIVLGGGYISTELRKMSDPRLFDYADGLIFDDGEEPLLRCAEAAAAGRPLSGLPRVATRERLPAATLAEPRAAAAILRHRERPAPDYSGLPLDLYFGMAETPNPMHRLWSERFWNKLQLAHGCYWHRCAFCDTSLDYIRRFDPADADTVLRWMDDVFAQTGHRGFHFTDEAAPPALLRRVAERLAARGAPYEWWTNIRLEPAFDRPMARTLARGGCIAATAGLECANDRLLRLMNKGAPRDAMAEVCAALSSAGIRVHVYLMYGFPTQTRAEAIEALDFVRRLFRRGAIHSAYWHRFALTCHSPIHARPEIFDVKPAPPLGPFARNEVAYEEEGAPDWATIGEGLRRATFNYMLGVGWDADAAAWFEGF